MKVVWAIAICLCFFVGGMIFHQEVIDKPCPEITTHTETIPGDSIPRIIYIGVPKPYLTERTIYSTLWMDSFRSVDTACILEDYLLTRHYADTFHNDTSCQISYYARVRLNRLDSFALMAQNNRATIINNYTATPKDRMRVFGGAYYTTAPGVCLDAVTGKWIFGAGFDLNKKALVAVRFRLF